MSKNSAEKPEGSLLGIVNRPTVFVRSMHSPALLEDFFVSAIVAILAIRLYLQITGFPQLEFGQLHIAHMLWGGLLMLVALVILLAFLDHRAKVIAAILGGLGFGTFIDELGKFITRDNDYFFQPTIALTVIVYSPLPSKRIPAETPMVKLRGKLGQGLAGINLALRFDIIRSPS